MKYPEFEQEDEDEDDSEDEDDMEEDGDIKLPEIITKETVLAVLRPNAVRPLSLPAPLSRQASRS